MKKPVAVKIAGWAFMGMLALGVYLAASPATPHVKLRELAGLTGYLLATLGFGVMWAGGTVAHRGRVTSHHQAARDLMESGALRRLAAEAGPRLHLSEVHQMPAVKAENCDECGKPLACLRCHIHKKALCWPCLRKHDAELECYYIPVWRYPAEIFTIPPAAAKG